MRCQLNEVRPVQTSAANADLSDSSGVSVIIPAHNAEATLEATLNSVVRQTHAVWEAVIIDDGSTDRTRALAEDWARRDQRVSVLYQEQSGVSAARNRGLREARCPFVLFLDSDDRIAPTHLESMAGMLAADSKLDAVHCGWQCVRPSGAAGRPYLGSSDADLFGHFASHCHLAIHACILRRELALAVGGFDPSLTTCEDWDFFQRVARTGARFGRVPEVLAFYHFRPDSASQNSRRCLADARVVLDRGHGRDPRMRIATQDHVEGRDPAYRNLALYYNVTYFAAQEIGNGRDGLDLLDSDDFTPAPDVQPETVAEVIKDHFAADRAVHDWPALWNQVNAPLTAFLARLEAQTRAPVLAFATLRRLEEKVALADPGNAPLLLGRTYRVTIDLTKRVRDVFLPAEADRLICRLTLNGKPIGAVELPGSDVVAGRSIAKAASKELGRLLLRRVLASGPALRTLRGVLWWRKAASLVWRRCPGRTTKGQIGRSKPAQARSHQRG